MHTCAPETTEDVRQWWLRWTGELAATGDMVHWRVPVLVHSDATPPPDVRDDHSRSVRVSPRCNVTCAYLAAARSVLEDADTWVLFLNDRARTAEAPLQPSIARAWVHDAVRQGHCAGHMPDAHMFGLSSAHWDFRMWPYDSGSKNLGEFAQTRLGLQVPRLLPNDLVWWPNSWFCARRAHVSRLQQQLPSESMEVDHFMERLWCVWLTTWTQHNNGEKCIE
jgi:hypothetical protein